jgi:hypothetical protein
MAFGRDAARVHFRKDELEGILSELRRGALQKRPRRTAFIAGLWFIGTFIFSIPAALLYDPVLSDPNYVLGGGADMQVVLGAFLEVLLPIIGPPKSGMARRPRCLPASSLRHSVSSSSSMWILGTLAPPWWRKSSSMVEVGAPSGPAPCPS